jgi:hypothetical protein
MGSRIAKSSLHTPSHSTRRTSELPSPRKDAEDGEARDKSQDIIKETAKNTAEGIVREEKDTKTNVGEEASNIISSARYQD